jgi:hypothetical protein
VLASFVLQLTMSSSNVAWTRLVRYVSTDNTLIQYGEHIVYSPGTDIIELVRSGKLEVRVCTGSDPLNARPTGQVQREKMLLGPLEQRIYLTFDALD